VSEGEKRPPRRKRYPGRNPRRFEDKYKERDPERHQETIEKVLASGKTPAGSHVPIMVAECLQFLRLQPEMMGVDATLGHGGHAAAILDRITPGGQLIGLDLDPIEMPLTEARLRARGHGPEAFEAVRSNYAGLAKVLSARGVDAVDFVFADLGCSSMQLDDPRRGFSFKTAGPLDMRMNPERGLPAADWLQRISAPKLAEVLADHSDEPRAESIAEALAGRRFADTLALAAAVREALRERDDEEVERTIRRVFQAVRIAVNEEFTALDAFLRVLPQCLKPGARAVVLTFHSGEDRRVKQAFKAGLREGWFTEMSDGVITAGPGERRDNPRSSPAKLRWVTRA
jgi:16S rRNA (cytosine1402-N4)-methyltransferase